VDPRAAARRARPVAPQRSADHDHTSRPPLQHRPDSTAAYDSTWTEQPATQTPDALEQIMLPSGKIYVVLAVVLLIWFGLLAMLVRTDRKIDRLERRLDHSSSSPREDASEVPQDS